MIFARIRKDDVLQNIFSPKWKFWLVSHFIISLSLFFLTLVYFRDTGLGDNHRIPIGHGQTIQNEDFEWTYFYPDLTKTESNQDELVILDYTISKDKICAKVSHEGERSPEYDFIMYDLPTKSMITFKNEAEYTKFAKENKLPLKDSFLSFESHFMEFLVARPFWKKWLIP